MDQKQERDRQVLQPKTDRLETGDAAADSPDVTAKMHVTFNSWTDEVGAMQTCIATTSTMKN